MAGEAGGGSFAPLRRRLFAVLWVATVLGNVGSFMRDVASAWLVTDLSASPAAVAAVQAAGTLPVFLLAIPAGVLADILDRRRFLILVQILLGAVSAALMLLSASGLLTVSSLIALTFAGGVGAALMGPTWQSIVPELVPRAELKSAVALNSLGVNIARSIGPAAGGALLAAFGAAATYGADVASYVIVILTLLWWRREPAARDDLSERFLGAFRAGLRYARASRDLHRVLARAVLFFACASSLWALLPLVARRILGGGPGYYGLLLGAVGLGAILGAVVLPRLRHWVEGDRLLLASALVTAAGNAALALGPPMAAAPVILLLVGAAWIAALTTLNAATQGILPNWVRGRGLALYLTVFSGAMSGGSVLWGAVAEWAGLVPALLAGAGALALVALAAARIRLPAADLDLAPSHHWPEPLLATPVEHDRGPVMVTVEYRVPAAERAAFLAALVPLSDERRRDGAYAWGIAEDSADPERLVEWFLVESWAEHLRQHRRIAAADADIQRALRRFHAGPADPAVRHLLAVDLPPRR